MLRRRGWSTLSKAFERSTAAATVRAGGRRELKPIDLVRKREEDGDCGVSRLETMLQGDGGERS